MPSGTSPIILGSPLISNFIFETGSQVTTSQSGIQECNVKALCANGANVFSLLPAAGASFNTVFGNSYLPSTFLVDYTSSGPQVEYLEGQIARVTFSFKRPDPTQTGAASRKVFVDSTINYKSILSSVFTSLTVTGETSEGIFGFPEPVVRVTYNTTSPPSIGAGDLSTLYALPGSAKAAGFPPAPAIIVGQTIPVSAGTVVTYFDGTVFHTFTAAVATILVFNHNFAANPRGWQLIKLKYDPVAASNFYDVEEQWRNFYFYTGVTFVSRTP